MAYGAASAARGGEPVTTSVTSDAAGTTGELRERVREAIVQRRGLRITGSGSWLEANRSVAAATMLSIGGLTGLVDYVPGDLTLTARAGTTLDAIASVTAAEGQWLALDPLGDPAASTIGATIATASYGSLAHHFGTPRYATLGLELVTGKGEIIRGGGRVVKNVAGFDLTRLITGSWGSLGATLRRLPFVPLAAQLLHPALASALQVGTTSHATLLVRIGGNAEAVKAQLGQLRAIGEARDAPERVWDLLRSREQGSVVAFRLSRLPSRFAESWRDAMQLLDEIPDAYCHGDPGRGVVRCVIPPGARADMSTLRRCITSPFTGTRIVETLPAELWPLVAPSAASNRLSHGIKRAFDPDRVMNPGILGEAE